MKFELERQQFVNDLFDRTAVHYDRICRVMSFGSGQRYRRDALLRGSLGPGMQVLDVATGTGLLAREALKVVGQTGRVVGLDPSSGMLRLAGTAPRSRVVQGLGERLPFTNDTFDFVSMGYALRHVHSLEHAFSEYLRVLSPGGHLLLLEITRPESRLGRWLTRQYFQRAVPLMARIVTGSAQGALLMQYYWDTIADCVSPARILASLEQSGFRRVERRVEHGIFSEYVAVKP